jgi:hypothetical protein
LDEKEEEWWQRLKKLEIEYGPELAARDLVAKEHILDYDPKQGGRLLHLTPPCLWPPLIRPRRGVWVWVVCPLSPRSAFAHARSLDHCLDDIGFQLVDL